MIENNLTMINSPGATIRKTPGGDMIYGLEAKQYAHDYQQAAFDEMEDVLENSPIIGSSIDAYWDFKDRNYWGGAFNSGMAISDVFLLKSIATGLTKGAFKFGSNSWSATRRWALKRGYAGANQPLHHWAIPRNNWGKAVPNWFKNQPWNLKLFTSQSLHMRAGHGLNYLGQEGYSFFGRVWYGTPVWPKAAVGFCWDKGFK